MPTPRRIATRTKARTWTAWLLLAVFIPIAGTTAYLWRAQVQRQNDQAFSAQGNGQLDFSAIINLYRKDA